MAASKKSFDPMLLILGAGVLGGGYLIYNSVSASSAAAQAQAQAQANIAQAQILAAQQKNQSQGGLNDIISGASALLGFLL
jgi:tetrahydromethanopterin S-methyltransferase subunit H